MNLVTKRVPWVVASLLAATTVFGQNNMDQNKSPASCPKGPSMCKPQPPQKCGMLQAPMEPTMCAYNAPAEINIGMQGDYDFFFTGSFLYWQPLEDNLDIGLLGTNIPNLTSGAELTFSGDYIDMDFDYKPGFQVGAGMNLQNDDWDGYAEYTRLHSHHHKSESSAQGTPDIVSTWGHPVLQISPAGQLFTGVSGAFTKNLDFVDAEMGRMYYVGKSLTFRPAWGARGAWIRDSMHVQYTNNTSTHTTFAGIGSLPSTLNVYQRVRSWAVGPRTGLVMNWMLGEGIRFFGSGYGDLLYTKYKLQDKTVLLPLLTNPPLTVGNAVTITTFDIARTVRAHLDFEMGFGWGSYFDDNNWYLDLSAAYGFQVFFDQNMFVKYFSSAAIGAQSRPNGNLYIQGLTATARLDF